MPSRSSPSLASEAKTYTRSGDGSRWSVRTRVATTSHGTPRSSTRWKYSPSWARAASPAGTVSRAEVAGADRGGAVRDDDDAVGAGERVRHVVDGLRWHGGGQRARHDAGERVAGLDEHRVLGPLEDGAADEHVADPGDERGGGEAGGDERDEHPPAQAADHGAANR